MIAKGKKVGKSQFFKHIKVPCIRIDQTVLVFGCILPIAAVAFFLIVNFYTHERENLTRHAASSADAMMAAVDREFASTQSALQILNSSPRLADGDFKTFYARALEELPMLPIENIAVLAANGQLLLTTSHPFGAILPKLIDVPLLKNIFETGKPSVSGLFMGPLSGRLIFTIAVPVKRNGSILYSLNATVAPSQLLSLMADQKLPGSWIGAIIDSGGNIVGRTQNLQKFLGNKVTPDLWQRLISANIGRFVTTTLDDVPALTVYSRSPISQWAVALSIPLIELTEGLHDALVLLILTTVSALIIGLALAWFFGERVARSVNALIQPVIALSANKPFTIPALHFAEANKLRDALLDASTKLFQVEYDAHHDGSTGMPNRSLFDIALDQQLTLCRRYKTTLAVLYIDVEGVNAEQEAVDEESGDANVLLRHVSMRIKNALRAPDMAARLGRDQFAIVLIHSDLASAAVFANQLFDILSEPYQLGRITATISASIGIAGYPVTGRDGPTLLKYADDAMHKAKTLGERRVYTAPIAKVT